MHAEMVEEWISSRGKGQKGDMDVMRLEPTSERGPDQSNREYVLECVAGNHRIASRIYPSTVLPWQPSESSK